MTERTTVRLPPDLLSRARRKALSEGSSLTALIERGLRSVVDGGREAAGEPSRLPVSRRTGWVLPGVDVDNSAGREEPDDISRFRSP